MTIRKTTSVAAIKVNPTALAHVHGHHHGHAHANVVLLASPSRRTSLLQRQVSRALEIIDLYDHDLDLDKDQDARAGSSNASSPSSMAVSPLVQLEMLSARTSTASLSAAAASLTARKTLGKANGNANANGKNAVIQISPSKRKRSASMSSNHAISLENEMETADAKGAMAVPAPTAAAGMRLAHRTSSKQLLQSKRCCSAKDKKKKRLKVDVVERALKRFHSSRCVIDMDERCFDFDAQIAEAPKSDEDQDHEDVKEQEKGVDSEHDSHDSDSDRDNDQDTCTVQTKTNNGKPTLLTTVESGAQWRQRPVRSTESASMHVEIGVAAAQGTRAYMEDRFAVTTHLFEDRVDEELPRDASIFALYDGHNGSVAAELALDRVRELLGDSEALLEMCRRPEPAAPLDNDDIDAINALLTDIMAEVDDEVLKETQRLHRRDGCTVLIGLLVLGKLFVANLGDSRGVIGGLDDASVDRLSLDHKPNLFEESARIESMGGKVMFSGCWRVAHDQVPLRLAVSRSLGDHPLKTNLPSSCVGPLVSVVPTIRVIDVGAMEQDSLVVFATDGLWDRLSDDDAIRIAKSRVTALEKPRGSENAMYDAAHALIDAALRKRSMDNITTMVIRFSTSNTSAKTLVEPDEEANAICSDDESDDDATMLEL